MEMEKSRVTFLSLRNELEPFHSLLNTILLQMKESFYLKTICEVKQAMKCLQGADFSTKISFLNQFSADCLRIVDIIKILSNCIKNPAKLEHLKDELINEATLIVQNNKQLKQISEHSIIQVEEEIKMLENHIVALSAEETETFANLSDEIIEQSFEIRYTNNWCNAKIDQENWANQKRLNNVKNEVLKYKKLFLREVKFQGQIELIKMKNLELEEAIVERSRMYDQASEDMDNIKKSKMDSIEDAKNKFIEFMKLYEEQKQWLINHKSTVAAVKIQIWWRQIVNLKRPPVTPKRKKRKAKGKKT